MAGNIPRARSGVGGRRRALPSSIFPPLGPFPRAGLFAGGPAAAAERRGSEMKARVTIMPKAAVLDPQGQAIRDSLHHLGLPGAAAVRAGKVIEIDLTGEEEPAALEARLHALCRDFLSNPVIEDYALELRA